MELSNAQIVFSSAGYAVDDKKQLYKVAGDDYTPICQLKKNLSYICEYNGLSYMIDKFGDCFIIDNKPIFIAGIIGTPTFFTVRNDRIFIHDSLSRLWVYTLTGRLEGIVFGRSNCSDVLLSVGYIGILYGVKNEFPMLFHLVDKNFNEIYSGDVDAAPTFNKTEIEYKKGGVTHKIALV